MGGSDGDALSDMRSLSEWLMQTRMGDHAFDNAVMLTALERRLGHAPHYTRRLRERLERWESGKGGNGKRRN